MKADWCIYASINHIFIGSDDGLLPVQAIIWTSDGLLSIEHQGIISLKFW